MIKKFRSYICVPSKGDYARGDNRPKVDCILCSIIEGNPEVQQKIIYKNNETMVVLNIYPYNPGHLLIFPIKHVENFEELSEEEICNLFLMAQKSVKLLKEVYHPQGFNIGINQGEAAGASVKHFHIQIVPRYTSEIGFMETINGTRVVVETLEETLKKLRSKARMFY
ncbi:MAG: HIT family protein [Candidatus Jordarchaeum sp.]|uniref:HIT family protein n=1 Tax=Candidatus Jordarchaeum sp. TaxID=2823881 RepID=UPI004049DE5A